MKTVFLATAIGLFLAASQADASVLAGPALIYGDGGWTVAGLSFTAVQNVELTSFTFRNQGHADTVVLTDTLGNILHSVATPAGKPDERVNVSWDLIAGQRYWLLQSGAVNARFVDYGGPLVSNADIAMVMTGTFDVSIAGAVADSQHWGSDEYWAAFSNIGTVAAPEPASLALFAVGVAGGLRRRHKRPG